MKHFNIVIIYIERKRLRKIEHGPEVRIVKCLDRCAVQFLGVLSIDPLFFNLR